MGTEHKVVKFRSLTYLKLIYLFKVLQKQIKSDSFCLTDNIVKNSDIFIHKLT